jgi:DNA polymerase-1
MLAKKPQQQSFIEFAGAESASPAIHNNAPQPTESTPSGELAGKTVYVVDSFSLIFQVFHALPEMSSPKGQPVSAVFGFSRDILYLLDKKQPDFLFCAFDLPGKTFRHELFAEYKIQRDEIPVDLPPQISTIQRVLESLGIPIVACDNYEADDVLATLARRCDQLGAHCYLVTGDKDCRQLITKFVKVYNVRKDAVYDEDSLMEDWGILPSQVVDFQALVGDSVDNVPGVPLIGPKIARELLQRFGTLDEILAHSEEITGKKRRQNLVEGRDQALLSRRLVQLDDQVPVNIDFEAARVKPIEAGRVQPLFEEFGFRNLSRRFREEQEEATSSPWQANYKTVATEADLAELVRQLQQQKRIAVDTETTSLDALQADLVGYCFAWQAGEAFYVPVRAPEGEPQLEPALVAEALRTVLEDPLIQKVGQNLKYDKTVLRSAEIELQGITFDTMIADYLLEAGQREHNLPALSRKYLGHQMISFRELVGSGRDQKRIDEIPVERVTEYAAEDADVTLRLADILSQRLKQEQLEELFYNLELPVLEVLIAMESAGIYVDTERLAQLSKVHGTRLEQLKTEIYESAGRSFNIASPKQLATILFEELQLPVIKKNKTGASTDADVLEQLALQHPLPAKIIEYRQLAKLKNTYLDALPQLVNPKTKRVHTSFNQVMTATGRLSSNDPNLQNIPVRTKEGREIRSAFQAGPEGWHLLAADYSQIELRVLAHFSGDENLCQAFMRDEDIHALVASQVYGVELAEVTSEMRRSAKAINFGIIYGQSPFGLAKALQIDRDEAAAFIEAYFAKYPGVDEFITKTFLACRENSYVTTLLGRRRAIQGVRHPEKWMGNPHQRTLPERTAVNTVIQGSAADLIKLAMIQIPARLDQDQLKAQMLLQIHDELIFETPAAQINQLAESVSDTMSEVFPLRVPLKVDVKTGLNWADCEPI